MASPVPIPVVDDSVYALSVQQHIHQLLCTDGNEQNLSLQTCRCHQVATDTLGSISSERNTEESQNTEASDLSKLNLLSMRQLEQQSGEESTIYHGCLLSPHHDCAKELRLKQDSIPKHSNILIGCLTNICMQGDKMERLYFKDHTGVIPCQILNCDMRWLRQLVVVYCWNYISADQKDSSYIEVCNLCKPHLIPLNDDDATDITGWPAWMSHRGIQDKTLKVEDAQQLMLDHSQDSAKKTKPLVTLHGFVTAKSPLYRVRGRPFFFVEVSSESRDSKVNILSKEMETAYLYHFLHIGKMLTITQLLPTTINKGTKSPCPVLACQLKTSVRDNEGAPNLNVIPTISGIIQKCINKEVGIYELEAHIRLYLCYMYDGNKQYQQYRVGTKIAVYNAHEYMLGKPPMRCIICCLRSTVIITEHSQQLPEVSVNVSSGKGLLHLILKLNPSPSRLQWLCSVTTTLQQKLGLLIYSKKPEHSCMWRLLTTQSVSNSLQWMTSTKRNVYEEFLNHSTQPCVATKSKLDNGPFCQFPCIRDLTNLITKSDDQHVKIISDSRNWKCKCIASVNVTPPKVLVGYLETNLVTGQLLLVDRTGSIQCLVTDTQSQMIYNEYHHTDTCRTPCNTKTVASIPPSMLDQVIRVDRCLIIMEEYIHHEGDVDSGTSNVSDNKKAHDDEQDWSRVYAVFDLKDTVILCPAVSLKSSSKKPIKRTAASASLEQPDIGMKKLTLEKQQKSAIFGVKNKNWPHQENAESTNLSFYCDVDYIELHGDDKDSQMLRNDSSVEVKSKSASFWFSKNMMKWFPVLIPSCVYHLSLDSSCPPSESVLDSTVQSSKSSLYKVVKKAGCTQVLCVSQFAKLQILKEEDIPSDIKDEYCKLQDNVKYTCKVNSITQVLQTESGPYDNVVSLWGLIVSCQYSTAKAARSHQTQPEWQMKLLVKDPEVDTGDDDVTVRVYINVLSSTYPTGLLPGSIVSFRRCIKVKSAKGNISFQVGPLSHINIEHVPYNTMNRAIADDLIDQSHCQNVFLSQLSTKPPDATTLFTVNGHVLMIHLLILRWSCHSCGRPECICPSTSHGSKPGSVHVQTRFSVDDGTGEAMVWCHDVQSVADLLGFKPALWNQLRELLPRYGKVVYRYNKEENTQQQYAAQLPQLNDDLESVLSMLCTHNSIQKPVQLKCRMLQNNQPLTRGTSGKTGSSEYDQSDATRKKFTPWPHMKCTEIIAV